MSHFCDNFLEIVIIKKGNHSFDNHGYQTEECYVRYKM